MSNYFYLTPVLGGPGAPRYPVAYDRQIIGRSEESEIALLEPTVSRKHAAIECKDGEVWLEDLQSKHGSFVNSKRINRTKLKVGDIVVFGLSIVLRLEQTDREVPPAMPLKVPGGLGSQFGPLVPADMTDPMVVPMGLSRNETAMHRVVPSDQKQIREITRLKDQLAKASKMSAAGTFCLSLIPDIHERVSLICQQLAEPAGDKDLQDLASKLEPALEGLTRIMKAIQVIPAPRLELTSISKEVHRAVEIVRPDTKIHRIKLKILVADDLEARTDPQRLLVALTEFLKSAIRSGRSGATVTISGAKHLEGIQLVISNQSQEISADGLLRVFDPFVTSDVHWQRLGLGIFEARQIIMSFGGTVTLESTEGLGTSVEVVLPAD